VSPAPSLKARRVSRARRASADRSAPVTSRDWTVLALVLVERLSLVEAAIALDITPAELRRRYERALSRLRRSVIPRVSRVLRESAVPARRAS